VRDASLTLGMTDGVERDCDLASSKLIFLTFKKSKPALLKKGLLRGESLSGHPEGAKAPEGPPTIS
jgi:hypothetical protein